VSNRFFEIISTSGKARTGLIHTSHGDIHTPVFMPVGTQGTVKTINKDELLGIGTEIILGNTYHLYMRPGDKLIKKLGGLHRFINWEKPILTDSGGYQVFSLGEGSRSKKLARITNDGVEFKSHLNGSKHFFTPEKVIDIQLNLGSDILMPLDVCPSANADDKEIEQAVKITSNWFERGYHHYQKAQGDKGALFAIIQGGANKKLREMSYNHLSQFDVSGFSIGGVANAGESKEKQKKALEATLPLIPEDKPRYLMGVGMPEDIFSAVSLGVDMFDCVAPTRMARNGTVFTYNGRLNLGNAKYKDDTKPIEDKCDCYACRNHTRAYIKHLLSAGEVLGIRLTTLHNLRFMMRLMGDIRESIKDDKFEGFKTKSLKKYR